MAELSPLAFSAGRSILHRHDIRFKLGSLALMTAACVGAPAGGLALVSLVLAVLAAHLRLPLRFFRERTAFLFSFSALHPDGPRLDHSG